MPTPDSQRRFHLTPGHCLLALLAVEFLLFLSQWFRWLPKGWPVLIAVAAVGVVIMAMFVWFGVAVVFRRRFQFSLRSLLVLVVAVALPCSWLAVEMRAAKRQKEATELITVSGCCVLGDDATDEKGALDLDKVDAELRRVLTKRHSQRPLVELLGWDYFHAATAIEYVDSSFLLVESNGCNAPRVVKTWTPKRAQAILLALKDLPDLRVLDLSDMPIEDCDLENVMPLKELRQLDLRGTKVTDAGVAKLQQALPNCKITR